MDGWSWLDRRPERWILRDDGGVIDGSCEAVEPESSTPTVGLLALDVSASRSPRIDVVDVANS
jgi:hypothetical protein